MSFAELLLLGVALSMDAFTVSVTNGMTLGSVPLRYALAVSLTFGTFQALMPLIGFFGGSFFYTYIEAIDHWVVLALLGALGGKMIFEAVRELRAAERKNTDCETAFAAAPDAAEQGDTVLQKAVQKINNFTETADKKDIRRNASCRRRLSPSLLLVQGIATSIDALAVGISLAAVNANITLSAVTIGVTTALICFPAVYIGKKTGDALNDKARLAGGCILIGIGIKICVQHLLERGDV